MLLRVRLNVYSPLSLTSLSSSSQPASDQSPRFRYCSLIFSSSKSPASFFLCLNRRRSGRGFLRSRFSLHPSRASTGDESPGSDVSGNEDSDQYLQASLLVPETIRHYNLWKEGFVGKTEWHSPAKKYPSSSHRIIEFNVKSIGHGFLRRFQSPTVFLKIACDGDLLLPIIVGEFSIIRLIDAITGEENEECPDQYQFVNNIVNTLGYEVMMVRITNRVVNTYYARIYLRKAADNTNIIIDSRPSDALNVAERFKAPIYVNKDIVVKDAIKVVYGNWRARNPRIVYDVSLDRSEAWLKEVELIHEYHIQTLVENLKMEL